jgi:hypothetical protein
MWQNICNLGGMSWTQWSKLWKNFYLLVSFYMSSGPLTAPLPLPSKSHSSLQPVSCGKFPYICLHIYTFFLGNFIHSGHFQSWVPIHIPRFRFESNCQYGLLTLPLCTPRRLAYTQAYFICFSFHQPIFLAEWHRYPYSLFPIIFPLSTCNVTTFFSSMFPS